MPELEAAPVRDAIVDRHRGLVGRTALVSALTLLSRIFGFVREVLSAALFGDASAIWDAFLTAFRLPNLLRRLFGEGAISTSLQAALTEADAEGGDEAGRRLFLRTARTLLFVLVGVCLVGSGLAFLVPDAVFGSDPGPVRELIVRLLPYVLLICIAALCGGALAVRGHFTTPNLAPSLMNVTWIVGLLWVGARYVWGEPAPATGSALDLHQMEMARVLGWVALLSGAVQVVVQVPALRRLGLLAAPAGAAPAAIDDAETRRRARGVLWTSLPLALGAAVYQINVMIDGFMAEAFLADGGPTALYLANRVQQFPLALIALAATSAVFPSLKALGHRGRFDELRALHDRAQLGVCFLALPAGVGLFLFAGPISSVLFEHGAYGPEGVARIAAGMRALAFALLPAGAVGLTSRAYFALGDFRTPVRISILALVANAAFNVLLVAGFGMDVEGLTLATALTTWVHLALLLPGLHRRHALPAASAGVWGRLARMALASAAAGGAAELGFLAAQRLGAGDALGLLAAAPSGVLAYFLAAHALRLSELAEAVRKVRARFPGAG